MKDIVIIGAGGFGREVAWLIEDINKVNKQWNLLGFIDDNDEVQGQNLNGYEVLGKLDWLMDKEVSVVNAIANPIIRKQIMDQLKNSSNTYPTLIHPNVVYSETVEFGEGNIICAGNILTVNIEIKNHVIINIDSTIGHDAIINDYCTILPSVNVSGHVHLEECVTVGTGSAIIQNVPVGKNSTIGAGAVVTKEIPANCTAVGAPAKPIKFH